MPFKSGAQRRYIYAQAAAGVAWARKFIQDSGATPPPVRTDAQIKKAVKRRAMQSRK